MFLSFLLYKICFDFFLDKCFDVLFQSELNIVTVRCTTSISLPYLDATHFRFHLSVAAIVTYSEASKSTIESSSFDLFLLNFFNTFK